MEAKSFSDKHVPTDTVTLFEQLGTVSMFCNVNFRMTFTARQCT